jgi:hypothetical protein
MPAEAGIQSVGDNNNFKDLDSRSLLKTCRDRLRGNDGVMPIMLSPLRHSFHREREIISGFNCEFLALFS